MPWFLTPHGPHFVVEPGTIDEYERRDYVAMTAQQVTDYYAGVAFPDPPSFATEAEVLPLVTAAVQSGAGALPAALRAASDARVDSRVPSAVARSVAKRITGVKCVVIFRHDDVQRPALNYLPVYDDHGVRASWYQVSSWIGTADNLTAAELQDLVARGHEVGSHTIDHRYFTTDAPDETERRRQLRDSKAAIEAAIGGDYVCETFAYPGNQVVDTEVQDYYLCAVAAGSQPLAQTMRGPQNFGGYNCGYFSDLVDSASLAATTTKTQTQVAAWKAVTGGTVAVIQAHNTTEMSVAQLDAILDVLVADPEVAVLTQREWVHYVRAYYQTQNGRNYALGSRVGQSPVRWNSAVAASAAFEADRLGSGVGFRARVAGTEVATLDDRLILLDGSKISQVENGHQIRLFNAGNATYCRLQHTASQFEIATNGGTGTIFLAGKERIRFNGAAALDVQTTAGVSQFAVDTSRGTMKLVNLASDPASPTVGEIALVNGVVKVCAVAGAWTVVGSQA